jgi:hypothetical protein
VRFITRHRIDRCGRVVIRSDSTFTAGDGGKHSENFSSLTRGRKQAFATTFHLARTPL